MDSEEDSLSPHEVDSNDRRGQIVRSLAVHGLIREASVRKCRGFPVSQPFLLEVPNWSNSATRVGCKNSYALKMLMESGVIVVLRSVDVRIASSDFIPNCMPLWLAQSAAQVTID